MATMTKRVPKSAATTKLEHAALRWLNRQASGYPDTGVQGAARDLFYGGCSSGIVSELVYTQDCEAFARKHIGDILALWQERAEEYGERPMPRGRDELDLNWLAWFGFEEAARNVCMRAGVEC